MERRERLRRCYFNEELDRPAVYSRTGFPADDPTYERLRAYLRAHTELKRPWRVTETPYPTTSFTEPYSEDFVRLAPAPLQTVCFRYHPAALELDEELDAINQALLKRLNKSGKAFLTHTRLRGRYCLRLSIGQLATQARHVEQVWNLIQRSAGELSSSD